MALPTPADITNAVLATFRGTAESTVASLGTASATGQAIVTAGTKIVATSVQEGVRLLLGPDLARNVDTTGDPFALIGSLQDVITDEARITRGPLSFADVLQYENRLAGIRTVIVIVSFAFSLLVEVLTLGQVEGFVGLLIHLVDDVVGDASRIVTTQLIRRAVSEPLVKGYARIHRHTDLSPSDAEAAFALGLVDEAGLVDALKSASFTDAAISAKVALGRIKGFNERGVFPVRTKFVPPSTLIAALRAGIVSDREFVLELARQGYDDTALAIYWAFAFLKKPPPPLEVGVA